jgi:glutathione-regulated potassium-efflux system protein KefB
MAAGGDIGLLKDATIYLAASVVAVPLFQRLKLGAILGYLMAGVVIGPAVLGLIGETGDVLRIAEFGVVLLLFIIGLELKPARLWALRRAIFGLGLAQVVVTGAALAVVVGFILELRWQGALIAGFALALSSTAFAVQILKERGELNSPKGETAFAVLLFQDLAIVPLLALVALLSGGAAESDRPAWITALGTLAAVGGVVVAGRYGLNPLFRILAGTGAREVLAAAALLIVVGTSAAFAALGLSMALGAFLAGVALADSEFRHQLEADIEPFRGLLLGLFFIAVGMGLDLAVIKAEWLRIAALVIALVSVKMLVLYTLVRLFKGNRCDARDIAATLAQGGEFGFVLFSAAALAGLFAQGVASSLAAVVTLSMALTPLLVAAAGRLSKKGGDSKADMADLLTPEAAPSRKVIVAGYGRFGQVVTQMLRARGIEVVLIDHNPAQIQLTRSFGNLVYFGDARRMDVLRAAGAGEAALLIYCVEGQGIDAAVIEGIKREFPNLQVAVRVHDRRHYVALAGQEVVGLVRETHDSAIALGRKALAALDVPETTIDAIETEYRLRDGERLALQAASGDMRAGMDLIFRADTPFAPAAFDIGPTEMPDDPANAAVVDDVYGDWGPQRG